MTFSERNRESEHSMRITLQGWLALFALGLCLWLTTTYFSTILQVGWILFGAFLLSVAIRPLADRLAHHRIPRSVTVLVIYLALIGMVVLLMYLLVPVLETEFAILRANAPALVEQLTLRFAGMPVASWIPSTDTFVQGVTQRLDEVIVDTAVTVIDISSLAVDLLVLFALAYLFAIDEEVSPHWLMRWFPPTHHAQIQQMWSDIISRLSRWSWAQLGLATYFAVIFSIGLALLGVPFALTIGLVGGLLEIVPFLGGLVAVLLAVFSALTVDVNLVIWVFVFYIVVAALESHVLAPVLYGRAIGLRSALVLIALIVGAKSEGILGVLFAVPAAVIFSAFLHEVHQLRHPDQ
jgi:predicted PurR-regulated permease PerM